MLPHYRSLFSSFSCPFLYLLWLRILETFHVPDTLNVILYNHSLKFYILEHEVTIVFIIITLIYRWWFRILSFCSASKKHLYSSRAILHITQWIIIITALHRRHWWLSWSGIHNSMIIFSQNPHSSHWRTAYKYISPWKMFQDYQAHQTYLRGKYLGSAFPIPHT